MLKEYILVISGIDSVWGIERYGNEFVESNGEYYQMLVCHLFLDLK